VNDWNLGEPRILWSAVKDSNRTYSVITNVDEKSSKIVTKYTDKWHHVNLNSLIFKPVNTEDCQKEDGVYYGSYRKGREKYFKKYFDTVLVSTHVKNRDKFLALDVNPNFIGRIDWKKEGLAPYKASLYIEDEITHLRYHFLANRFYEALNYGVVPIFDKSCSNTLKLSGYDISEDYIVDSAEEFAQKVNNLPENYKEDLESWKIKAAQEKEDTLKEITNILTKA
jgi:hypothetical protein